MASRITVIRSAAVVLVALMAGGAAPDAVAQSGNGLYEPFPEAAVKKRAQRYVERLGDRTPEAARRYSDAQLDAGVFVRPDPRGPALRPRESESPGPATTRAGAGARSGVPVPIQLLLVALVLAIPAAALMRPAAQRAA